MYWAKSVCKTRWSKPLAGALRSGAGCHRPMMMMRLLPVLSCSLLSLSAHALDVMSPAQSFITRFDRNGDGKLNVSEFLAIRADQTGDLRWQFPLTREGFHALDRDRNGYLDNADELPVDFSPEVNEYIQCWPRPAPCR